MTTPLYPTFNKRISDAIERLIKEQVTPWSLMAAGPPFRVNQFDGKQIAYQGIGFDGSPREVFWSRYIEPFLEHLCISEIAAAVSIAKDKGVDGRLLLSEMQALLSSGIRKVYARMADIDRRLRGKGYPNSVGLRSTELEIQHMDRFLDERILTEIEMWRSIPMPASDYKRPRLVVPEKEAEHKLQIQIEKGRLILSSLKSARGRLDLSREHVFEKRKEDQEKWAKYSIDLLKSLFSDDSLAKEFGDHWIHYSLHGDQIDELDSWMNDRIGRLKSIKERLPLFKESSEGTGIRLPAKNGVIESKDVFIVHGHDDAVKHEVARFLEKIGLNPIILHELPDKGRTIIEKFEANANVGFAVVLLTPDDIGHPKDDASKTAPRARQNVILELGFFLGKLERHRVCALKKGDIEVPTDYSGVLYKSLDKQGAWKLEFAKKIKEAGIEVDMNKAF